MATSVNIPDAIIPLAGFRRWVYPRPQDCIGYPRHTLITHKHAWPVGAEGREPIKAECKMLYSPMRKCAPHTSPRDRCECGLYAFHDLDRAKVYRAMEFGTGSVMGAAIGWGTVYFDNDWFRAEWMLPIAFVDPRDTETHMAKEWLEKVLDWLEGVAKRYRIPILPLGEIEAYAYQYGATWKVPPLTDEEEEARK